MCAPHVSFYLNCYRALVQAWHRISWYWLSRFLYFPASKPCPLIDWSTVQTRLYSLHGSELWTSVTLGCLVRSVTQTHLAASLLPSVGDTHTAVYIHTHTHMHALLGTQTLARIGCRGKLSGLQCSHACILADRDKPLFDSLTHTQKIHMHASTWQATVGWHKGACTVSCETVLCASIFIHERS